MSTLMENSGGQLICFMSFLSLLENRPSWSIEVPRYSVPPFELIIVGYRGKVEEEQENGMEREVERWLEPRENRGGDVEGWVGIWERENGKRSYLLP